MASEFHDTDGLVAALADATFDRPPAVVANAHITGLGVARALAAHDVPVVAVDRNGDGVAHPSDAVAYAGEVAYPLDDPEGFRRDLARVADASDGEVVAFGCMDEWVHTFADAADIDGVVPSFSPDRVDAVLDKDALYALAEELGVPYPETHRLWEVDPGEAADALGFPLVVKPALKREFEEAVGTNVVEVDDREEFEAVLAAAAEHDVRVMAQERVNVATGEDCSLASYVPERGDPLAVVGNARVRFPRAFGTSCLVETVDRPALRDRTLDVLEETGYRGISEAEYVYDADRGEYVLLDINTRPWKWISMPVQAGANLPVAAYADAVGADVEGDFGVGDAGDADDPDDPDARGGPDPSVPGDARWVYLRDYLELLATDDAFGDVLSTAEWRSLVSGEFEDDDRFTTAVYRPGDPGPMAHLLDVEFSGREYYCAC